MKLDNLTTGEALLTIRYRSARNQEVMAEMLNISKHIYGELETDKGLVLEPHEKCRILRRRAGMTQEELASVVGVSREWLNSMEQGNENCKRLVEFWRG